MTTTATPVELTGNENPEELAVIQKHDRKDKLTEAEAKIWQRVSDRRSAAKNKRDADNMKAFNRYIASNFTADKDGKISNSSAIALNVASVITNEFRPSSQSRKEMGGLARPQITATVQSASADKALLDDIVTKVKDLLNGAASVVDTDLNGRVGDLFQIRMNKADSRKSAIADCIADAA